MDLESVSFTLAPSNTASNLVKVTTTTTATFYNINLRMLLGTLYGKYDLYRLNVSGIFQRVVGYSSAGYAGSIDIVISGLSFINIYDTGLPSTSVAITTTNTGANTTSSFSNANGATFEKGSSDFINITINAVNTDMTTFNGVDFENIMFKITGIPREPIYKPMYNRNGVKFVLNSIQGSVMDTRNRVFKFNVDMKVALGKLYDLYDRFVLQTTRITLAYDNSNMTTFVYSSDSNGTQVMLSGLKFVNMFDFPVRYSYQTTASPSQAPASTYYKYAQVPIGVLNNVVNVNPASIGNLQYFTPFLQNTINQFEKQSNAELVLVNSYRGSDDIAQGGTSAVPFPNLICEFIIYGV